MAARLLIIGGNALLPTEFTALTSPYSRARQRAHRPRPGSRLGEFVPRPAGRSRRLRARPARVRTGAVSWARCSAHPTRWITPSGPHPRPVLLAMASTLHSVWTMSCTSTRWNAPRCGGVHGIACTPASPYTRGQGETSKISRLLLAGQGWLPLDELSGSQLPTWSRGEQRVHGSRWPSPSVCTLG